METGFGGGFDGLGGGVGMIVVAGGRGGGGGGWFPLSVDGDERGEGHFVA